jgi:Fe-S cluster assembly protein SufD
MVVTTTDPYVAEFERFDRSHPDDPGWLRAIRHRALARFVSLGFPTTKHEEWRFTNVAPIATRAFHLSGDGREEPRTEHVAGWRFGRGEVLDIVFVNGHFSRPLSAIDELPRGLSIRSLREALSDGSPRPTSHLGRHAGFEDQPFVALNTAFLADGALVEIAPNTVVDRPVHVVFVSLGGGAMAHPRVLLLAGRNCQVRVVERYVGFAHDAGRSDGLPDSFTNAVTEIVLDDGAVVDHYRVQRETPEAFHVSATCARLAHSANFSSHAFTFGGAVTRNDVSVVLAGEGGDAIINGLYLADGSRLVDNHTFIDHAQPHCGSHEVYKGILGGAARAVFNGKILVRPDAQKTDAKQTNKTLLLSDDAQINTKPQLEIFANDVKCTHGATVGQLSAEALFYLQSRGIDRQAGQQMLIRAFAADITSRVRIDSLREQLDKVLLDALQGSSE